DARTKESAHSASAGMLRCCSQDWSSSPPAIANVKPVMTKDVGRSSSMMQGRSGARLSFARRISSPYAYSIRQPDKILANPMSSASKPCISAVSGGIHGLGKYVRSGLPVPCRRPDWRMECRHETEAADAQRAHGVPKVQPAFVLEPAGRLRHLWLA